MTIDQRYTEIQLVDFQSCLNYIPRPGLGPSNPFMPCLTITSGEDNGDGMISQGEAAVVT